MSRSYNATINDLQFYSKTFSRWFESFELEVVKAPLSFRERNKINAIFDDVSARLSYVVAIVRRAKNWEAELCAKEDAKTNATESGAPSTTACETKRDASAKRPSAKRQELSVSSGRFSPEFQI